jgi:hypothetical protein
MKRNMTTSRVAARPTPSRPVALLIGAIYGMAAGLTLALFLLSGLLPDAWALSFPGGPLAFQGFLTTVGAILGTVAALVRRV